LIRVFIEILIFKGGVIGGH